MPDDTTPAPPTTSSDLISRLQADMKTALKAGEKEKLGVIRMLLAEAKNADLQKPPSTPQKMVEAHYKRLKKSREEYEKLGKPDEVAQLDREITVVEAYVPRQASAGDTANLVDAFLAEHPEFTGGDVGRATGQFMKANGGNVDPAAANARIRQVLSSR